MRFIGLVCSMLLICLTLHPSPLTSGQEKRSSARKIDEFADILVTDIKARLDNFAIELQKEPDSRGFIIVYRSRRDPPGITSRLSNLSKNYLVEQRGLDADRIVTIDGGESPCLAQELWVVPKGDTPTPRPDAYRRDFTDTESVRKFDEYYYYLPYAEEEHSEAIELGDSLEAFADALRKEPRAFGYIIAYPQYYVYWWEDSSEDGREWRRRRVYQDRPSAASTMLREIKADLVKKYRVAPSRIKVMNGGYRKTRSVELWIVPRGEHAPIPTPNAFPKGRGR